MKVHNSSSTGCQELPEYSHYFIRFFVAFLISLVTCVLRAILIMIEEQYISPEEKEKT